MKMKNSIWNLVWVCLLCSCNSWLDIKLINPSEESELFRTERGFSEALAGVYYDMSAAGLYGQTLSFGMLDVMSRTYDYSRVPNAMKIFRDYDYEDKDMEAYIYSICMLYMLILQPSIIYWSGVIKMLLSCRMPGVIRSGVRHWH